MTEKSKSARTAGRPPYRAKLKDRMTVEQMKFCGESDNVIARALGIDPDTLRKHFCEELANGHAERRREVIELLFDAARDKNVTAIKKLEEMGRVAAAADAVTGRGKAAPKIGKKAEQQAAAEKATERFAVRQPPKLVASR